MPSNREMMDARGIGASLVLSTIGNEGPGLYRNAGANSLLHVYGYAKSSEQNGREAVLDSFWVLVYRQNYPALYTFISVRPCFQTTT
jgi:hypothetical protein